MGRHIKREEATMNNSATKISDILPYDKTLSDDMATQIYNGFVTGFNSIDGSYEVDGLKFYATWFTDYVYRKYKNSFILSYSDDEMAWNKMFTFYSNHIKEMQIVDQMWGNYYDTEESAKKLLDGVISSSKVTSKVSGTPQDGTSYVDDYPDTETLQTSESTQGDKSVLAKMQEVTKKLTSYKKTWAEMFRKEMGLWIAL